MTFSIFTWGNKPAAASVVAGTTIRISDVGVAPGILVTSDGANWTPEGAQVLARVNAAGAAITGGTTEVTAATVVVPAGLLGANGSLRIASTWSLTNNANSKTLRLRYGGTPFLTAFPASQASAATDSLVSNRGAANSQVASAGSSSYGVGPATTTVSTGAVDSSTDQNLVLTMQLGTGTDSVTLERYLVEVLP